MTTTESELVLLVKGKRTCADGVVELDLVRPDGGRLPSWQPGAHVDVVLGEGLSRQYSLCGDPADAHAWRIAVLLDRETRGGSRAIHESVHEGTTLEVRGPRNRFELRPAARYVFIAGGIGITPILPMIGAVAAAGHEWELHYGGRTAASMAYAAELAERHGDRVRLVPEDEAGLLDLDTILTGRPLGTSVYCCGPAPLLDAVRDRTKMWPAGTVRTETFRAEVDQGSPGEAFEVELASTGTVFTVGPDQSILDVLVANQVDVLSSCEEGTCGTCETGILSGTADHRDTVLEPEEQAANTSLMICVSRASCPRLVLDL